MESSLLQLGNRPVERFIIAVVPARFLQVRYKPRVPCQPVDRQFYKQRGAAWDWHTEKQMQQYATRAPASSVGPILPDAALIDVNPHLGRRILPLLIVELEAKGPI